MTRSAEAGVSHGYDPVARALHWLTALLVLSAIAVGYSMTRMPSGSEAEIARILRNYSLHKTIGVATLIVAVARILWALTHRRPGPLHPDRRLETLAASITHWVLYGALVVMPLSGWIYHSASPGFAPILWPLAQDLPLVPKSDALSHVARSIHLVSGYLLYVAVALHVLGAFKHAIFDMDATMARMTSGTGPAVPRSQDQIGPALVALGVWAATLFVAVNVAPMLREDVALTKTADPFAEIDAALADAGNLPAEMPTWSVMSGTLSFDVVLQGRPITGTFSGWSAEIRYDEENRSGTLNVLIPLAGLDLGTMTQQALGPDLFGATEFPEATLSAVISPEPSSADAHIATGTLVIRGISVPVEMPFRLDRSHPIATVSGTLAVDRTDFGIGAAVPAGTDLGTIVTVRFTLEARQD